MISLGIIIMIIPFLLYLCLAFAKLIMLIFIILGINKANLVMSKIMRIPMNWLFGGKSGDELLWLHKEIELLEKKHINVL